MRMLRLSLSACLFVIIANTAFADSTAGPENNDGWGGLTQSFIGLQTGCINDFTNNIGLEEETDGVTLDQVVVDVTSHFTPHWLCRHR
jgi:hypothetical protein